MDPMPTRLAPVEVTGSHIKRSDYETAQPVVAISRQQIEQSGLTSVGDLLQALPSAGAGTNLLNDPYGLGATEIDLRNLGTSRVLILVNGHRWVSGQNFLSTSSVDVSTIPLAIIDHIEILQDGASAVYGSDAIAGVINIITRKDFYGLILSSQYGRYTQGDGARQLHDISWGRRFAATNLFANFSFQDQRPIYARDRGLTRLPQVHTGITRGIPFNQEARFVFVPNLQNGLRLGTGPCPGVAADTAAGTLPFAVSVPALASQIPGLQLCDITHTAGTPGTSASDFHSFTSPDDFFNHQTTAALLDSLQTYSAFVAVQQRFTNALNFSAELLYNRRRHSAISVPPFVVVGDHSPLVVGNGLNLRTFVSRNNPYNPFGQDIGRADPAEPANQGLRLLGPDGIGSGAVADIFPQTGPEIFSRDVPTEYAHAALGGLFELWSQAINWEIGLGYGTSLSRETASNLVRLDHLQSTLGDPANCAGDCVPLNLFGGPGAITPAMLRYIRTTAGDDIRQTQLDGYGNLSFDIGGLLPAGALGMALGFEVRRERFEFSPDALYTAGLVNDFQYTPTRGSVSAQEAYAELSVPILRDLPLAKVLELNPALRYSHYGVFGSSINSKIGLRWKPYEDLLIRSSYSSAFRAPDAGNLYLGTLGQFGTVADPCVARAPGSDTDANCTGDGVRADVQQLNGTTSLQTHGNPDLKPETSHSLGIGLVVSPEMVPGLDLSLDYFRISLVNFITLPEPQFILDACYRSDPQHRNFCEAITRSPNTDQLIVIQDRYANYSRVQTSGVDYGLVYRLPTKDVGSFKLLFDASFLASYNIFQPGLSDSLVERGYAGRNLGNRAFPRWKISPALQWRRGSWSAVWSTRIIWHQTESCFDGTSPSLAELRLCSDPTHRAPDGSLAPENHIKTGARHDVQIAYAWAKLKSEFALGAQNVLNTDPPVSYSSANFDKADYWVPGAAVYLRMKMDF